MDILEKIYDEVVCIRDKVDAAIMNQGKVNNQFFECRGRGKNTNKIVFLLLSVLLASQFVVGYFAYPKKQGHKIAPVEVKTEEIQRGTNDFKESVIEHRQTKVTFESN